jgi:hypothetical protein
VIDILGQLRLAQQAGHPTLADDVFDAAKYDKKSFVNELETLCHANLNSPTCPP